MKNIKLKVGVPCRTGMYLTLSKKGNLRPIRPGEKINPFGAAITRLRRGDMAIDDEGTGKWRSQTAPDPRLTAVSLAYLDRRLVNEVLAPNPHEERELRFYRG